VRQTGKTGGGVWVFPSRRFHSAFLFVLSFSRPGQFIKDFLNGRCAGFSPGPGVGWSRFFNSQIPADFSRKEIVHFRVARDSGAAVQNGIFPPRMVGSFADEPTTLRGQMADEFAPFHTRIAASS
jgi:hypothetical protein